MEPLDAISLAGMDLSAVASQLKRDLEYLLPFLERGPGCDFKTRETVNRLCVLLPYYIQKTEEQRRQDGRLLVQT